MSDESADARDRVVDVLRKFVAEDLTNIRISPADEIVGSRKPGQIGYSFQVPHDDAWFHQLEI